MSMLTNWGYELPDIDILPAMMDASVYEGFTGRDDDTTRVTAEILAASAAVRNFVGWHLAPLLNCRLNTIITDRRCVFAGPDLIIQLPARYVTAVSLVSINEHEYSLFHADPNGLLRVFDVGHSMTRYAPVVVEYTAGLPEQAMAAIYELLSYRVMHTLVAPLGITSEASGGVSVTYNSSWIGDGSAGGLTNTNRELLTPYKVQGVF